MPLPTDDLIVWASSDVNLPNLAGPNKVKPIDDLILKGWDFKQKPAADEFNYVLNNLGMHVSYLEESKTYTFSGDVTGTATSTGSDDITFNVSVTDNSHNHTSANISDATPNNVAGTILKRDDNGDVAARNFVGTASYASTATNNVAVLTGVIANGGTIPLPSGYSEGQCRWMVSMNNDNASDIGWDIDEEGAHVHYKQQVYTTGRVVTAQTYLGSNNSPPGWISSTANYIIIGVK